MLSLTPEEIVRLIKKGKPFMALAADDSFSVAIDDYVPYVCTALHNGGNLRERLRNKIRLNRHERWYEEDPLTSQFVSSLPVRLLALDSRYEYDLNRAPDQCVYGKAWGKEVWAEVLTVDEIKLSRQKHAGFYSVVDALISYLVKKFKGCVVYDIHSYNYRRIWDKETPLFNLGTSFIDRSEFGVEVDHWLRELGRIRLPQVVTTVQADGVFQGRGYLAEYIAGRFPQALVLPTEIKKVYCDEESGDEYPKVIETLSKELKRAIVNHASRFINRKCSISVARKSRLLSSGIEPSLRETDARIHRLCRDLELLEFVNPVNTNVEKRKFFNSGFRYRPLFRYKPLKVDPFGFKEELFRIPFETISDVHIQDLYKEIIDSQSAQIDMLATRGEKKFLYNSLRYFGEPDGSDIRNANWILHSPDISAGGDVSEAISAADAAEIIRSFVQDYGFDCKVDLVKNLPAKMMFVMTQRKLHIKADAGFTRQEAEGLGHHEIGLHMLTTANAAVQPLKILQTGFPVYTYTQEGLATAAEYLAGLMNLRRLKELALRVVAVRSMIRDDNFAETFSMLVDTYRISEDEAFYLCVRVYRGGGFTKDYLYLRGFRDIINIIESGHSLENLLIGKTSARYLPLLDEMIERTILTPPVHVCRPIVRPTKPDPIMHYLVKGIKPVEIHKSVEATGGG